jgi:DNA-binding protein HU-beta
MPGGTTQCAFIIPPRCPNMLRGKGLYCSLHKSFLGDVNKLMTHSQIIDHFVDHTGLGRAEVKQMFSDLSALAARELKSTGEFVLPRFGRLVQVQRQARGRNPATGEEIQISARTALKFRVGKNIKNTVLGET